MTPLSRGKIVLYAAANMGANATYAFANLAFPLFLSTYPVANWVVGLLAQERSFVGAFVQPAVGYLSDRLPRTGRLGRRRPFFLVGVPLTAASLMLLASHPPLWLVVAIMTVLSFFLSVAYDPYLALLADIAPEAQRARIGAVMAIFNMLGGIAVIAASSLLWERNEALVFGLVGAILVGSFAVTFFGIQEPTHDAAAVEPEGEGQVPPPVVGQRLSGVVAWGPLGLYLASTFAFWLGNGGIVPFVTRFGVDVLGVSESTSFLLVLPAILGAAVFALPAGLAADRFGKRGVLLAGQALFGAAGVGGAFVVQDVAGAVVVMSLVGVANAITTSLTFPLLTTLIPRDRAATFTGVGGLVWSIAQPIGAVLAGLVADSTGSLRGAFAAGGVAMLIASVLLLAVRVPRAAESGEPALPVHGSTSEPAAIG